MIPTTTAIYSPSMGQAIALAESIQSYRCSILSGFPPMASEIFFMAAMPESGSEDEVLYPYVGAEERFYLEGRWVLTFKPVVIKGNTFKQDVVYA